MSETPLKRQPSRRGAKRTRSSAADDAEVAAGAAGAGTAAAAGSETAPAAPAEQRKRAEQIQSQVQALLTELEPATPAKPGAAAGVPRPNLLTPQRTPSRAAAATAAGAGAGAMDVTATPTRATREEEQKQLRDLNKRLELYIVKMREKDASSGSTPRELELFKEKKEQELVSLRKLYEEQLQAVRSDRDRISADLVQATGEKTMRESLFGQQAGELAALKKYKSELESQMKKLTGEQQGAAARVFALEEQSKKLALELENSKVKAGAFDKDSTAQRARADAHSSQLAAALAKAKALEEDLALERKRAVSEVARYEQTIVELTRKTSRSEDQVRKEFHKQMSAALAERQQQYEDEKNEGLSTLKAAYDEKMNAFREELERVGHELEAEKSAGKSLQSEILRLTTLSTELMAIRDSLANRIAELEELLKAERLRPNKLIAEKNDVIRRIKAAFKRKDAEFDELMDVKIALAMEIKAYRSMLEREEERLGLQSPLKKRKRAHGSDTPAPPTPAPAPVPAPAPAATPAPTPTASRANGAAPAAAASTAKPAAAAASAAITTTTTTKTAAAAAAASASANASDSSSLLISGADLDGQYITIRNGSTETVPLLGWALKSKVKGSKFQFPDIRLLPGQSFVVRTAEGARAADAKVPGVGGREHAGASAWCSCDVWDSAGDEALLVDPEGEVIARVEVIPTGSLTGNTPLKTPAPALPNPAAAAAAIAAATKQVQAQAQAQAGKPAAAAAGATTGPAAVPTLIPQPRPALNAAPTPATAKPAAAAAAAVSPAPAKPAAAAAAAAPLLASPKPAAAAAAAAAGGQQQPQQQNCTIM